MDVNHMIDILVETRLEMRIPQAELAKKCGIQQNTLANIENHSGSPQYNTLSKIAENLGYEIQLVKKD